METPHISPRPASKSNPDRFEYKVGRSEGEQDLSARLKYLLSCQAQTCEREIAREKREGEWR